MTFYEFDNAKKSASVDPQLIALDFGRIYYTMLVTDPVSFMRIYATNAFHHSYDEESEKSIKVEGEGVEFIKKAFEKHGLNQNRAQFKISSVVGYWVSDDILFVTTTGTIFFVEEDDEHVQSRRFTQSFILKSIIPATISIIRDVFILLKNNSDEITITYESISENETVSSNVETQCLAQEHNKESSNHFKVNHLTSTKDPVCSRSKNCSTSLESKCIEQKKEGASHEKTSKKKTPVKKQNNRTNGLSSINNECKENNQRELNDSKISKEQSSSKHIDIVNVQTTEKSENAPSVLLSYAAVAGASNRLAKTSSIDIECTNNSKNETIGSPIEHQKKNSPIESKSSSFQIETNTLHKKSSKHENLKKDFTKHFNGNDSSNSKKMENQPNIRSNTEKKDLFKKNNYDGKPKYKNSENKMEDDQNRSLYRKNEANSTRANPNLSIKINNLPTHITSQQLSTLFENNFPAETVHRVTKITMHSSKKYTLIEFADKSTTEWCLARPWVIDGVEISLVSAANLSYKNKGNAFSNQKSGNLRGSHNAEHPQQKRNISAVITTSNADRIVV